LANFLERQALKESKRFDFNEIPRDTRTKAMQDDGEALGRLSLGASAKRPADAKTAKAPVFYRSTSGPF
jgi:hypothetical protein